MTRRGDQASSKEEAALLGLRADGTWKVPATVRICGIRSPAWKLAGGEERVCGWV